MRLSDQAINELRSILKNEILDKEKLLTNEDINTIGLFLLAILFEALKRNELTNKNCSET